MSQIPSSWSETYCTKCGSSICNGECAKGRDMLKMPEIKSLKNKMPYIGYNDEVTGWNDCHDQWLAYHKQECIKARIDELERIRAKLGTLNGQIFDHFKKERIATLQAELKEGKDEKFN